MVIAAHLSIDNRGDGAKSGGSFGGGNKSGGSFGNNGTVRVFSATTDDDSGGDGGGVEARRVTNTTITATVTIKTITRTTRPNHRIFFCRLPPFARATLLPFFLSDSLFFLHLLFTRLFLVLPF